jgi:conjugal transfer pilin signal peptidase TrbI
MRAATAWDRLSRTLPRALPLLLGVLALLVYLGTRFHVAINDQVDKCLPPYRVFLVDRHDRRVHRGGLYAFFAAQRMQPFFPLQTLIIKQVVGGPGDRVSVDAQVTRVNGKPVGAGLDLAETLGHAKAHYVRSLEVPQDALWVMGATRDSFDSRYWGPLPAHQILGRAYALF